VVASARRGRAGRISHALLADWHLREGITAGDLASVFGFLVLVGVGGAIFGRAVISAHRSHAWLGVVGLSYAAIALVVVFKALAHCYVSIGEPSAAEAISTPHPMACMSGLSRTEAAKTPRLRARTGSGFLIASIQLVLFMVSVGVFIAGAHSQCDPYIFVCTNSSGGSLLLLGAVLLIGDFIWIVAIALRRTGRTGK
jgi:hypothetical protein